MCLRYGMSIYIHLQYILEDSPNMSQGTLAPCGDIILILAARTMSDRQSCILEISIYYISMYLNCGSDRTDTGNMQGVILTLTKNISKNNTNFR